MSAHLELPPLSLLEQARRDAVAYVTAARPDLPARAVEAAVAAALPTILETVRRRVIITIDPAQHGQNVKHDVLTLLQHSSAGPR